MERFPRGTLPPSAFAAIVRSSPGNKGARPLTTLAVPDVPAQPPREDCDLASTCPNCGTMMQPEHAHYRCLTCGYRDSCCF
ncbi:MAG: hypothetical protein H6Q90_3304 [Deltaproteobacteria bacterium]|nr:hypothetical protein [Deltaproteobacteria bacterium]